MNEWDVRRIAGEADTVMNRKTAPYDTADYLETPRDIVGYLKAALEDEKECPGIFRVALGTAFRASKRIYPELQGSIVNEREVRRIVKELVEETTRLNDEPWWKPILQSWGIIFVFVGLISGAYGLMLCVWMSFK